MKTENELDITDTISKLIPESLSEEEKILKLEQGAKREAVIKWLQSDPEVKIIIAFSGGKDSIYMVLYFLFELNVPADRIELWHHDIDGHGEELFDWKTTPEYCRAFAKAFGLKLLFSYRKNGIVGRLLRLNEPLQNIYFQSEPDGPFHEVVSKQTAINEGGRWPAVSSDLNSRWCSAAVKISVAQAALTNDPRLNGTKEKPSKILFCTGERHDESTARESLKEVEVYRASDQRFVSYRHVLLWRPNVDVTERQVWDMMEKHKVQAHPCYMIGWNRCSCQLCIFNRPPIWNTILEISPEKVIRIRELEEQTASFPRNNGIEQTLYHGRTILEQAVLGEAVIDVSDPENAYWIKQATVKYDHPIIIDNWTLPKGAKSKITCGAT